MVHDQKGDDFMKSAKWILRVHLLLLCQVNAQDYLYETLTGGGYVCSAGYNDITDFTGCQQAFTDGEGVSATAVTSTAYPSGCSLEVGTNDLRFNSEPTGTALAPDGTTFAILCRY
eukprot:symbB.v1.2.004208.t1/scaffold215.1/size331178/1